jgi:hypothetical protein
VIRRSRNGDLSNFDSIGTSFSLGPYFRRGHTINTKVCSYELVARMEEMGTETKRNSFSACIELTIWAVPMFQLAWFLAKYLISNKLLGCSERNSTVISRAILSPGRPVHERPETKAFFPPQKNVSCLVTIVARSIAQSISSENHSETGPIFRYSKARKVNAVSLHFVSIVQKRVEDILSFNLTTVHMDVR